MSLTRTEREVLDYCRQHEFVSPAKLEEFAQRLQEEGNSNTLLYALEKFRNQTCPNCNAAGAYKWHFMGKHNHPDCGSSWYISPGAYIAEQFRGVFRSGTNIAADMSSDADKKGDKAGGCVAAMFGFLFGAIFRLIFAILMIPIQTIVSLTQNKPKDSTAVKQ